MVSRVERTPFAAWWWTVDRLLLAALLALMLGGIVLSLAASPPVASRLGLEPFYFVNRHVLYLIPALIVLLATSFLPPRYIRRIALVVFAVSLVLVAATLRFGAEVKGARRWIVILGVNLQPSEFLKPAFVILIAWLFGESARRPEMPANTMALALLMLAVARPGAAARFRADHADRAGVGRAVLPGRHADRLGARARRGRRDRACRPPISRCRTSPGASSGSWIPPPATPSTSTRRSRSFSAAAGSAADRARARSSASCRRATPTSCSRWRPRNSASCCACSCSRLFAFVVMRALRHALRNDDPFTRFAVAGLAMLFGLQSAINMAVNLHLMPGQGHDPAVHLLRRLLDDLARLWHGHAAGPDPRTPARRVAGQPRRIGSRRERGVTAQGGAPLVLVAAGGTGGHLFPAEALADALARRGITVDLATDERASRYGGDFPARHTHVIAERDRCAGAIRSRWRRPARLLGFGSAGLRLLGRLRPAAVVGFGGYPTMPPVLAATLRRFPPSSTSRTP